MRCHDIRRGEDDEQWCQDGHTQLG
jgi:hypothetical protein